MPENKSIVMGEHHPYDLHRATTTKRRQTMTMLFTFNHTDPGRPRRTRWPLALATALLIAVAAPVSACDKASPTLVAGAPGETRGAGVFTGEFVSGAPVYRLPAITVVGQRGAKLAQTRRNEDAAPVRTSRDPVATPVAAPSEKVATATRSAREASPCLG
jgi:hypothetical protein